MTAAIVYDFEFLEDGQRILPISLGAVAEDGRHLYAVFAEAPQDQLLSQPDSFVRDYVWPHLPTVPCPRGHRCISRGKGHLDRDHPDVRPAATIARLWSQFVLDTPARQLWADHAAYDHVAQAQLFGTMQQLPAHVPMFTREIQQEYERLGSPLVPVRDLATEHHALHDARHGMAVLRALKALEHPQRSHA